VRRKAGDLGLLRGELVNRVHTPLAGTLARRLQLDPRPLGERLHPEVGEELVGQSGGQPISWVSLGCEMQRDWAREETVPGIVEIVLTERLLQE
jgi:hypothetical protein